MYPCELNMFQLEQKVSTHLQALGLKRGTVRDWRTITDKTEVPGKF